MKKTFLVKHSKFLDDSNIEFLDKIGEFNKEELYEDGWYYQLKIGRRLIWFKVEACEFCMQKEWFDVASKEADEAIYNWRLHTAKINHTVLGERFLKALGKVIFE